MNEDFAACPIASRANHTVRAVRCKAALVREDPARAERLVERLAALLRFSLDSNQALTPLRREIKIVTDYLEIERARFGDRLKYSIDIPEALLDAEVPPMSIQTLVENCVKHAISHNSHTPTSRQSTISTATVASISW